MPLITALPPPAPRVVGPKTKTITRPSEPLPQYLIDQAKLTPKEDFDPTRHLSSQSPMKTLSMKEIGLEGHGISPTACAGPFQLFSDSAIQQFRREIFSDEVLRDCQFSSTFNKHMIRGMGPKYVQVVSSPLFPSPTPSRLIIVILCRRP